MSDQTTTTPKQKLTSLSDLAILLDDQPDVEDNKGNYRSNSFQIVAPMMYLIGVRKRNFENHRPSLIPEYDSLEQDKDARVIRNLCYIRSAIMQHFKDISREFYYGLNTLETVPNYIDPEVVIQLRKDGITPYVSKPDLNLYIVEINKEISNHINNVKKLFPEWLNWEYVKQLFIMPNGTNVKGTKANSLLFNSNWNRYPFICYINIDNENFGNLLLSDAKFVQRLYEFHEDYFENMSLVKGISPDMQESLNCFLERNRKTLVVVDCENSNPIKLAAALSDLSKLERAHIYKVMLFDSAYTTTMWTTLCRTGITNEFACERQSITRLYEHKSQVDMALATQTCREVYCNEVDSVILVSSDSDYWAMINTLSDIEFLVMLERDKSGDKIKTALTSANQHYCYIDDFCTAQAYNIKKITLFDAIQTNLDDRVSFNISEIFKTEVQQNWLEMSAKEQSNFYDLCLKTIRLSIDTAGNVKILVGD